MTTENSNGLEKKITEGEFIKLINESLDVSNKNMQLAIEDFTIMEKYIEKYNKEKKIYNMEYFIKKEEILYVKIGRK